MDSISSGMYVLIIFILMAIIGVFIYYLMSMYQQSQAYKAALQRFSESFNELDEQAKLIVKTDLDLNNTQEELDKLGERFRPYRSIVAWYCWRQVDGDNPSW